MANEIKTSAAAVNTANLEKSISQLRTKLARQQNAVKDTEAHIQALEYLKATSK